MVREAPCKSHDGLLDGLNILMFLLLVLGGGFVDTGGWECHPAMLQENKGDGDRGRGLVTGIRVCFVGIRGWECHPTMLREYRGNGKDRGLVTGMGGVFCRHWELGVPSHCAQREQEGWEQGQGSCHW